MGWSEFDNRYDHEKSKHDSRRLRKRFDKNEDAADYKHQKKHSNKRFHRKKTLKDEFWEDDNHGRSQQ